MTERKVDNLLLLEFFKLGFNSEDFLRICRDNLAYQLLPTEGYKELLKQMLSYFKEHKYIPTIGSMSQLFSSPLKSEKEEMIRQEVYQLIYQINQTPLPQYSSCVLALERFIKEGTQQNLIQDAANFWNKNQKEKAMNLMLEKAKFLSTFSLGKKPYPGVSFFKDWKTIVEEAKTLIS